MAIEIAFETSVDVADGGKSLKALKQEFKDIQKELNGLQVGSDKYIATLKKLGAVKDEIGDLNQTIKAFNPDAKLASLGKVMGGLAGGFSAATSAVALFGGESKDLEKALLKVQAAMAFQQGLEGLEGLKDGFKDLSFTIKSAFASNPMGLILTGITALGTALTAIWFSLDKTSEATRNLTKASEDSKKSLTLLEGVIKRQIDLLTAQGASEETLIATKKKLIDVQVKDAELSILVHKSKIRDIQDNDNFTESVDRATASIMRKLGQTEAADIIEKNILNNKANRAKEDIEAVKKGEEDILNFKNQALVLDAGRNTKSAKDKQIADKAAIATSIEDREAGEAAWKQLEEQINQDTLDRLKDRIKKSIELEINSLKVVEDANADSELKKIALAADRKEEILRQTYEQSEKTLTDFDNLNAGLLAIDKETNKQIIDSNKKTNDAKTADDKAALALKKKGRDDDFKNALQVTQSLQHISDIYFTIYNSNLKKGSKEQKKAAEDQFKINKALNLASATITGVKSVMDAYEAGTSVGGPYALATGAAYAAVAGIAVAAQLVKIASTDFDSGSSSGVDTSSFTSTPNVSNVTAPTINNPNSGQTSLNPDGSINNGQNNPQPHSPVVRAYVVESEITATQLRVGRIQQRATL